MRKVTIILIPNSETTQMKDDIFNKIKSIEALQILKTDFDKGVRLGIGICTLEDGFSLEELKNSDRVEILDVIKAEANKYTCFIKVKVPKEHVAFMKSLDLDLIWDTPTIITHDKLVISVIGDRDSLKRFLDVIRTVGKIESISYSQTAFMNYNVLSCLTDRQREVILEAKRSGYYEYPRRINGEQLAGKIGISKAATIEHLRKAEARIMSNVFNGY